MKTIILDIRQTNSDARYQTDGVLDAGLMAHAEGVFWNPVWEAVAMDTLVPLEDQLDEEIR